jgi:hypothetical protein
MPCSSVIAKFESVIRVASESSHNSPPNQPQPLQFALSQMLANNNCCEWLRSSCCMGKQPLTANSNHIMIEAIIMEKQPLDCKIKPHDD